MDALRLGLCCADRHHYDPPSEVALTALPERSRAANRTRTARRRLSARKSSERGGYTMAVPVEPTSPRRRGSLSLRSPTRRPAPHIPLSANPDGLDHDKENNPIDNRAEHGRPGVSYPMVLGSVRPVRSSPPQDTERRWGSARGPGGWTSPLRPRTRVPLGPRLGPVWDDWKNIDPLDPFRRPTTLVRAPPSPSPRSPSAAPDLPIPATDPSRRFSISSTTASLSGSLRSFLHLPPRGKKRGRDEPADDEVALADEHNKEAQSRARGWKFWRSSAMPAPGRSKKRKVVRVDALGPADQDALDAQDMFGEAYAPPPSQDGSAGSGFAPLAATPQQHRDGQPPHRHPNANDSSCAPLAPHPGPLNVSPARPSASPRHKLHKILRVESGWDLLQRGEVEEARERMGVDEGGSRRGI